MKKKMWVFIILGIIALVLFVVGGIWIPSVIDNADEKEEVLVESTLVKAVNVFELSTAKFNYNGIAEYYENAKAEQKEKVTCYIHYNATVKATVDMSKIKFEIDNEKKTVKPIFPEIEISERSIDLDESTLSFIPAKTTIELGEALKTCQNDVVGEAKKSEELIEVAEKNLENAVEALLIPILKDAGYVLVMN